MYDSSAQTNYDEQIQRRIDLFRPSDPILTEVPMDHVEWALLDAYAETHGDSTAPEAELFWSQVASEIESGFKAGALSKREGFHMASMAMPLRVADIPAWLERSLVSCAGLIVDPPTALSAQTGTGSESMQLAAHDMLHAPMLITRDDGSTVIEQNPLAVSIAEMVCNSQAVYWIVACAVGIVSLLALIIRHEKADRQLIPVVLGLLLSAFELVAATEWICNTTLAVVPDSASYFYATSFYPLVYMAAALLFVRAVSSFIDDEREHGN